ncbi:MAG: hypothetical protein ACXACB_09995 [Promethearchaeota archaeon]|jgi:hypothetical protein
MVHFQAFEEGMQVNGTTIMAIVAGLGGFKELGFQFLAESGLEDVIPDGGHWYSQQKWLDAFRLIASKVGNSTLFQIGRKIPENAVFPDEINDIESSLRSIDVAYHMNHRNQESQVLFDPNRDPPMLEGIGHYGYEKILNKNRIVMECNNPYPDDFDRGIITTMARRFVPGASIEHDNTKQCRKRGDDSCTYSITW